MPCLVFWMPVAAWIVKGSSIEFWPKNYPPPNLENIGVRVNQERKIKKIKRRKRGVGEGEGGEGSKQQGGRERERGHGEELIINNLKKKKRVYNFVVGGVG